MIVRMGIEFSNRIELIVHSRFIVHRPIHDMVIQSSFRLILCSSHRRGNGGTCTHKAGKNKSISIYDDTLCADDATACVIAFLSVCMPGHTARKSTVCSTVPETLVPQGMLLNEHTTVSSTHLTLVPYAHAHVERYHSWMQV